MNFKLPTTSDSLDKIKCSSCKNYLSYFPITVSKEHFLCGRCPSTDVSIQIVPFETLAQLLKFPCRYESVGCREKLFPKEVPHHEKHCMYLVIPCPLNESVSCSWQGPRCGLLEHCQELHSDLVLKNKEFDLDLTKSGNVRNVVEVEKVPLFFDRKYDAGKKKLEFALYTCVYEPKVEDTPCRLEITWLDKSLRVEFKLSKEEYVLRELSLASIIEDETNSANGKLVFEKFVQNDVVDVEMLSVQKSDEDNKNTAELKNYSCKYFTNGCTFVAKLDEITKHQLICVMASCTCPYAEYAAKKCLWNGTLKEVDGHIQSSHSPVFASGSKISVKVKNNYKYNHTIKFANRFFRLSHTKVFDKYSESYKYFFAVQVIGPYDNFQFEIAFESVFRNGIKLSARKICNRITNDHKLYQNFNYYCVFFGEQINGFHENENVLNFRVEIFKS